MTRRTFNGSSYGSPSAVDTADAEVFQATWHDTDVRSLTSLFYYDGLMYFTRSGQNTLFRRGFEPESDIVGQQRFSSGAVSGIPFTSIRGAFVANNFFYYATSSGLFRTPWGGRAPVAGTPTQISSSSAFASRVMFIYQASGQQSNQAPIPDADVTCTGLTCEFDSTDSVDPDGDIESVLWQFGDTATSTEETTSHTYATSGPRTVTLTVTDDDGSSASTTRSIDPQGPPVDTPPTANIASANCTLLACTFSSTGSGDSQGPVTYLWDFGDDGDLDTSTEANPSYIYGSAGPKTVTLTVKDTADQVATDTENINPSDTASPVTFVGKTHTNGNRTGSSHAVAVPAGTTVGDTMVLFFAANTTNPTYTYPAGWTPVANPINGSGVVGRAFTKVATAADIGSTVRVTSSAYAKSDMAVRGLPRGDRCGSQLWSPAHEHLRVTHLSHGQRAAREQVVGDLLGRQDLEHLRVDDRAPDLPQQCVRHLGWTHVRPAGRQRGRRLRPHGRVDGDRQLEHQRGAQLQRRPSVTGSSRYAPWRRVGASSEAPYGVTCRLPGRWSEQGDVPRRRAPSLVPGEETQCAVVCASHP